MYKTEAVVVKLLFLKSVTFLYAAMLDVKATGNAAACCWWFVTHLVLLAQIMYMQIQILVMPLDILNVKKLWLACTRVEAYNTCMHIMVHKEITDQLKLW